MDVFIRDNPRLRFLMALSMAALAAQAASRWGGGSLAGGFRDASDRVPFFGPIRLIGALFD